MTDLEKPKTTRKKKPPTQTAGVSGIDGHGGMGAAPPEPMPTAPIVPAINWGKLTALPAFEMFVFEESGQPQGSNAAEWVAARRAAMGDDKLYDLYQDWHQKKGLWPNESPFGIIKGE